jgi:hypothetical protein
MKANPHTSLEPLKITLLNLDNADVQDITRALEGQAIGLTPEEIPGGRYGDPGTVALALVAAAPVVRALAAWLLKPRRKGEIKLSAKVVDINGTESECSLSIKLSESDATEASVVKQLIEGLGLDATMMNALARDDMDA